MEEGLIAAFLAFALGGVLKGAIGAGTPVVAIPIMALYYDVPFAVSVFVLPAFLSNLWQIWRFRSDLLPIRFVAQLGVAAGTGALVGSVMLANLPSDALTLTVACLALAYVGFRLTRPDWQLAYANAYRIVLPVGLVSGILQGAAGISAPVSVTFLNAMKLNRTAFIGTASTFFLSMSLVQIPALVSLGVLTMDRFVISIAACVPLFGAMPVGGWLARFIDRETFDRIVLALLTVIALRLIWEAFAA